MRVAFDRFPHDERLCDILAYTLRAQRKLLDAEHYYRQALALSAEANEHSWDGLIVVLALQERFAEANEVTSAAIDLFPTNSRFAARREQLLSGTIDEPTYPESAERPGDISVESKLNELRFVRQASQLHPEGQRNGSNEVSELLEQVGSGDGHHRPRIALERVLSGLANGNLADAEAALDVALRSYPHEVSLLHAAVTLRRARGRQTLGAFSSSQYRWLTEPIDLFEVNNPALGALGDWSRLLALATSTDGDEWRATRASVLGRFARRLMATNVAPGSYEKAFVRVWTSRIQSNGQAILSSTFEHSDAMAAIDDFQVLDQEYALLGSAV
jgi:tetratricopeptide (TPR) repeat protein